MFENNYIELKDKSIQLQSRLDIQYEDLKNQKESNEKLILNLKFSNEQNMIKDNKINSIDKE